MKMFRYENPTKESNNFLYDVDRKQFSKYNKMNFSFTKVLLNFFF